MGRRCTFDLRGSLPAALSFWDNASHPPVTSVAKHIVIDPRHSDMREAIGMPNLRRAGFGSMVHVSEAPSFRALPVAEESGQRVDIAFIDGFQTFDFTLVEFFSVDRILNVVGVVVFDDADWPAIRNVCRFVRTNLVYAIPGTDGTDVALSLQRQVVRNRVRRTPFIRRPLSGILRSNVVMPDERMTNATVI